MNKKREIKEQCYLDALENNMISVEMTLNHLHQIEEKQGIFDKHILHRDYLQTILNLELSLATLCILLRKMSENLFIVIDDELRKDMNSIIHSNRFEYNQGHMIVYSKKGREEVYLNHLLDYCHQLLLNDKIYD